MNRTVYVKSSFKPLGKNETVEVDTGETKKGILGQKKIFEKKTVFKQTGVSDKEVDGNKLSIDIQAEIENLNSEGFEVISITPITSGEYNHENSSGMYTSWGYGYGYSYTEGVIILAKKINS